MGIRLTDGDGGGRAPLLCLARVRFPPNAAIYVERARSSDNLMTVFTPSFVFFHFYFGLEAANNLRC